MQQTKSLSSKGVTRQSIGQSATHFAHVWGVRYSAVSNVIKLYQYELSPFCTKVALILNVKNISYEVVEVPLSESQKVKRYSPTAKLPTIEYEGRFVDDSTDIVYFLEDKYPEPSLVPKVENESARCHIYEDWADESLNFYMMKLRWLPQNRDRWSNELAKHDRGMWQWIISKFVAKATLKILDKQGIGRKTEEAALQDLNRHIQAISTDLNKRCFLIGELLSIADISVYAQLKWIYEIPEGKSVIDKYQNVLEWLERVDLATQRNT